MLDGRLWRKIKGEKMQVIEDGMPFNELPFGTKVQFFIAFIIKSAITSLLFIGIYLLKFKTYDGTVDSIFYFLLILTLSCAAYFIFYIISEGILKEMIIGLIVSFIGGIIATFIPIIGIIILIIGIISMIKTIINIFQMIPLVLLGICLFIFLFDSFILDLFSINFLIPTVIISLSQIELINTLLPHTIELSYLNIGYFILSLLISINLSFKYSLKNAIFRQCVILMAIPIVTLLILLIRSAIGDNISQPQGIQGANVKNGKVWVNSYTRANGTFVKGFFRSR
ncbi:hypothetical protein K7J14_15345 [Treponema zuelzerae]|uniref:Uncharacterized protein n=1 Tax=Teretinema zuelzerae TaxID=156 RepID=A0AAE3EMM7_9SPIR|nr:hypothetical protein [Teretinema zuelzerae]MCD1656074.1 hypothetical protein [Teretinema zuelzerae]